MCRKKWRKAKGIRNCNVFYIFIHFISILLNIFVLTIAPVQRKAELLPFSSRSHWEIPYYFEGKMKFSRNIVFSWKFSLPFYSHIMNYSVNFSEYFPQLSFLFSIIIFNWNIFLLFNTILNSNRVTTLFLQLWIM